MLVGRTRELDVLNSSFRQMLEGKGNILFLTGEAGLGKTTLVHEWWKTAVPDSAIYAEAACSIPIGNVDVGRLEALQPWADIVVQLETHSEKDKKKFDVKKLIHDAAPSWAWAIPFVGDIAHAAVETHRLAKEQRGESETNLNASNQQQVFQQYVNLLTKISETTPLVILLDDMHWADASSTNLLFYLSRQINEKKILVIATYRPDDAIAANKGEGHPIVQVKNEILRYGGKECSLSYLDRTAISELLIKTFPEYKTDDTFERWLLNISDGNSLFVAQFIKTLREDNWLTDYGKFVGQYENITVPPSALAVVEERTRRLDRETCELLRYATAEGEEFTSYVLARLRNAEPLELLKELRRAESEGIVRKIGSSRLYANQTTTVFGFSHALFHQALYDGLLDEEKEVLHRRCFDILKTEWDRLAGTNSRTNSLASKLLTHAEKCGEIETAAEIALEAAHVAWSKFGNVEALEMIENTCRLANIAGSPIPEMKRRHILGEAMLLKARIQNLRGNFDIALQSSAEAVAHFQSTKETTQMLSAMNQKADVLRYKSAFSESLSVAQEVLAIAEKNDDTRGIAGALNTIAILHAQLGKYDEAFTIQTRCLQVAESIGDMHKISGSLNNLGIMYAHSGKVAEALEYYHRSMAIRESLGHRWEVALSLNNIGGILCDHLHEFDNALGYFTRSIEIYEALGDRRDICLPLTGIGTVKYNLGEYDEALAYHRRSLEAAEAVGYQFGMCSALLNMGIVYRVQGDFTNSRSTIERVQSIGREYNIQWGEAQAECELGLINEAESALLDDAGKAAKMKGAVDLLEKGIATLRDMKYNIYKDYEKDLARIKNNSLFLEGEGKGEGEK